MLLQDSMVVLEKLKKLFLIKRRNTIIKGRRDRSIVSVSTLQELQHFSYCITFLYHMKCWIDRSNFRFDNEILDQPGQVTAVYKREGKVLRVLPSGRWVPRNQG
jgi:hypothetical protein